MKRFHLKIQPAVVWLTIITIAASSTAASTAYAKHPSAMTAALPQPTDMRCLGWERDTVVVGWTDNAPDETAWKVERQIGAGGFSEVASLAANVGEWRDLGADVSAQNRHYRVRSYRSGDNTFSPYSETCNNRHIYENGPFRIFYGLRGGADECPLVSGQNACTGNVSFVNLQGDSLQGARSAFQRVGFALDAGVPSGSLDKIPINVVWCDGGGCAGGGGLGLSPFLIEKPFDRGTRVGDPAPYVVAEHELFHYQQGRYYHLSEPNDRWVIEGQARSTQDKVCLGADRASAWCFDDIDTGYAGYVPEVKGYLGNTITSIRLSWYQGALFWTYLTEKFGTNAPTDLTEGGMNFMSKFWEQSVANPAKDAVFVINKTLQSLGSSKTFREVWKDFAVANVAKDLSGPGVPTQYLYADQAQTGGDYGPVMYTVSQTLNVGDSVLQTSESVNPWGARYYQVRPNVGLPIIPIKITQDSVTPLFYDVLGIKGNDILFEQRYEQRNIDLSLINNAYDRVVVVVAGLENIGNYRISINGTLPRLNILSPTTANQARVGSPTTPEKFLAQVEVVDGAGLPLSGINLSNFSFQIGARTVPNSSIVVSATIQGQHWFVIQAVTQTVTGAYDLRADYSTILSATQTQAVNYVPRTDADNVLVVDRSGSMGDFGKMNSAKQASRLFVDSWRTGDKIGVESFSDTPSIDMNLTDWTTAPAGGSRQTAFDKINALSVGGATAIGDALLKGWDELKARGNNVHDWALILVSDGLETAGSKTFDDALAALTASSDPAKKPVVHTVAIGPDADRLRMQNAANATNGTYQYVSAPSSGTLGPETLSQDVLLMPLNIDQKYRYIAADVVGHQQFFSQFGPLDITARVEEMPIPVEANASEMVISLSWLPDLETSQLFDGDGSVVPVTQADQYHRIWRVSTPKAGLWKLRVLTAGNKNQGVGGLLPAYFVQGAIKTAVTMNAFIDTPMDQRVPGEPIHIVALLTDNKPIKGATVSAHITGPVPVDGNPQQYDVTLHDDGLHGDGAANDGAYGNWFYHTSLAGSYPVLVKAVGNSAIAGNFTREAVLAFHLNGKGGDTNQNGLPDDWEQHFPCLTGANADPKADPDKDGSPTYLELRVGTNPCNPDTDGDGKPDGSDKNPLEPDTGKVTPPWSVVWPGANKNWLKYVLDPLYKRISIYRTTVISPTQLLRTSTFALGTAAAQGDAQLIATQEPPTGVFTDTTALNGQTYCYSIIATDTSAEDSLLSPETCATTNVDFIPPHGGLLINNGAQATASQTVSLTLIASDSIDPHDKAELGDDFMAPAPDSPTGLADMMISERSDMQGGVWEPYAPSAPWTLSQRGGLASVFVKYRDHAGNESLVYAATIHTAHSMYLPLLGR